MNVRIRIGIERGLAVLTKPVKETAYSRAMYIICRTVRMSVDIPQKSVPMVLATKGEFLRLLRGIAECCLKVTSSTSVSLSSLRILFTMTG